MGPRSRHGLLWLPAAVAAAVTAGVALARPDHARLTDLGVYTGAVDGLRHGASLYDFVSAGDAPFTYPPFAGLVLLPLAGVPAVPLQVLWTLASLATVVLLALLLDRRRAPAYALILILSAPVSSDLKYGQVSLFLAAAVAVDVLALRHSRWQGVLIGLAAAVKLTPLIFIPMLWLTGRRRAAATAAGTFAVCGLVALAVLPGDSWRFWTGEIFRAGGLSTITGAGNQSLNGALLRFGVSEPARPALVLVVGGGVAAVALWHAARLGRRDAWLPALVVTGAASVVLSPVSWTHHQSWLVMAALLPVRGKVWSPVVLALMLLPVTALGPPLWENSRLLLAITVATLAPLLLDPPRRSRPPGQGAAHLAPDRPVPRSVTSPL